MIVSSIVLAYHGCDRALADKVIDRKESLKPSQNKYDWLGEGVYFWENSPLRALQWAELLKKRSPSKIKDPAVIGAVIDLGHCLDSTDQASLNLLKKSYTSFVALCSSSGSEMPKNEGLHEDDCDLLLRYLDCAVINHCHQFIHEENLRRRKDLENRLEPIREFDSVRGIFYEGKSLFEGSKFREKTHIQIAVRNPDRILGYFWPKDLNE